MVVVSDSGNKEVIWSDLSSANPRFGRTFHWYASKHVKDVRRRVARGLGSLFTSISVRLPNGLP